MSKDMKTQMRDALDYALNLLRDDGKIPSGVRVKGIRLDQQYYHIDFDNVAPMLLIRKDEGYRILAEEDMESLSDIILDHMNLGEKVYSP